MTTAPIKVIWRQLGRYLMPALILSGYLVVLFHWTTSSGSTVTTSLAAGLIAIGSLAGLTGAYLVLLQVLLQSRLPLLEAPFGRAGLVKFHRGNGYAVIIVLLTHATLLTTGYALNNQTGIITQFVNFWFSFPYVMWSIIALGMLLAIVGISISIVRRHLRYESWYLVHLFTYGAVLLAFFHQLSVGVDFSGNHLRFIRDFWVGLYILVLGSAVTFRFGRPVYRLLRFGFRVSRVIPEADNIYSVYVTGRDLDRLPYSSGQFMIWRFLDGERWWQAHPFTISRAAGKGDFRLTFKVSGDFTSQLSNVKPGTPVLLDGPYGDFTLDEQTNDHLLFIAGGIGLTPLRAMLETLKSGTTATLLYSARLSGDIALRNELETIARQHKVRLHFILSDEERPGYEHGILDAATLTRFVPDLGRYEVYLCGPPPMMAGVTGTLVGLGVKAEAIHTERFAF